MDHRNRRKGDGRRRPNWDLRHALERVAVDDISMGQSGQKISSGRSGGRSGITGPGGARSLLPGQVVLGEALLPSLALPVVITYPSSIDHKPAAELAKHGFSRHNSDLAGPIRVW